MPKRIVERGKIRGHEAFREKLDVKLRKTLELILKRTTEWLFRLRVNRRASSCDYVNMDI
ncbi:hypothetical protein J6590_086234 [Homalodisca vitripennis]|nr:hypothetical protein J6590_086234 [Homalodisca vitripennis]